MRTRFRFDTSVRFFGRFVRVRLTHLFGSVRGEPLFRFRYLCSVSPVRMFGFRLHRSGWVYGCSGRSSGWTHVRGERVLQV